MIGMTDRVWCRRTEAAGDARIERHVAEAGAALWRARSLADAALPRTADHVLLRATLQRAEAALADAERLAGRIVAADEEIEEIARLALASPDDPLGLNWER